MTQSNGQLSSRDMPKGRIRAVDEGVAPDQWRRVHWITPLLNSWQGLLVLLAIIGVQGAGAFQELMVISYASRSVATVLIAIFLLLLAALVAIVTFSYFSWRATSYAVTDQAVWLRKGIFFRSQRHVRFERIQAVDVVHPLLGRIFGLGKLTVEAAGGSGSNLQIGFLKSQALTDLRAEILARAAGITIPAPQHVSQKVLQEGIQEAPETPVYSVTPGRLVSSLLLSGTFVVGMIVIVGLVSGTIIGIAAGGPEAISGILGGVIPGFIAIVALLWARFAGEFNFRVSVSPDGLRIRRGLTEARAETIPPRRIHAVAISQPLLWRRFGWYRVTIAQAARNVTSDGSSNTASSVLLPVGDRQQAVLALWMVLPDLGVVDPERFFDEVMHGNGRTPNFLSIPKSARIFDPMDYKRRAVSLTGTSMVVRRGRLTHRASFVPYERVQSTFVKVGPLDRRRGLGSVTAAIVPGTVTVSIGHLSDLDCAQVLEDLTERSKVSRSSEPPEKWLARVEARLDPRDSNGPLRPLQVTTQQVQSTVTQQAQQSGTERWKPQ